MEAVDVLLIGVLVVGEGGGRAATGLVEVLFVFARGDAGGDEAGGVGGVMLVSMYESADDVLLVRDRLVLVLEDDFLKMEAFGAGGVLVMDVWYNGGFSLITTLSTWSWTTILSSSSRSSSSSSSSSSASSLEGSSQLASALFVMAMALLFANLEAGLMILIPGNVALLLARPPFPVERPCPITVAVGKSLRMSSHI